MAKLSSTSDKRHENLAQSGNWTWTSNYRTPLEWNSGYSISENAFKGPSFDQAMLNLLGGKLFEEWQGRYCKIATAMPLRITWQMVTASITANCCQLDEKRRFRKLRRNSFISQKTAETDTAETQWGQVLGFSSLFSCGFSYFVAACNLFFFLVSTFYDGCAYCCDHLY